MIVTVPNPVLTKPAKTVKKIDRKIIGVIAEMKKTLIDQDNPKGVGLAAPQVGIPYRIFITKPTSSGKIEVFLNPEIVWKSDTLVEIERVEKDDKKSLKNDKKLEGCLSIPNVWGHLKRSNAVRLKYIDEQENLQEKEFKGFMATIVQHETDHLNGILFTQRVLEQKEKLYEIEVDDEGKEKLVEIKL